MASPTHGEDSYWYITPKSCVECRIPISNHLFGKYAGLILLIFSGWLLTLAPDSHTFDGAEIVSLNDVRLFHIHWKNDSTKDRSEGYLYYPCSQSPNLSIYTCVPGVCQRSQVKYGPFCGLLTFVLLSALSFMIFWRSWFGLFDFRAVYNILVMFI